FTMWRTSQGERVLKGAEWPLLREGLAAVWDLVEDSFDEDNLFSAGVEAFDELQPNQKLAMLALVGRALGDEATPPPQLTALTEGTAAAVFACVREMITMEVERIGDLEESEDRTFWRRLVLTAYREAGCAGNEALPEATCNDLEEWTVLLDGLSDR